MSSINTPRAAIAAVLSTMALSASLFPLAANASPTHADPNAGSVSIPDRVALKKSALGRHMKLQFDSGDYALQPASLGQYCDTTDNGATGTEPSPIGGQQWSWSKPDYSTTVGQVVTVWEDADAAFADVVNDTGACRYEKVLYEHDFTTVDRKGRFILTTYDSVTVTTKVDRALVSVQVSGTDAYAENLRAKAIRLSDKATAQVDRANI